MRRADRPADERDDGVYAATKAKLKKLLYRHPALRAASGKPNQKTALQRTKHHERKPPLPQKPPPRSTPASAFDMPEYGFPKFGPPHAEMPEAFREMTEKGVAHAKDANAKAKAASEEAADLLQNSYADRCQGMPETIISSLSRLLGPTLVPPSTMLTSCWVRSPRRSLSSCRPRRCASNSMSFPRRIRSFARSLRGWRPRWPVPLKAGVSKVFNKVS